MQKIFIGIPVDEQFQRRVNTLLMPFKSVSADIRWVPEVNRHMTLAFLGDVPESRIGGLVHAFGQAYQEQSPFQFHFSGLNRFPGEKGRIIALTGEVTRPLEEVFQNTREFLQNNYFEFDQKSFRPHITLGRIKKPKQVKATFSQKIDLQLDIRKVVLYRSTSTKTGSVYSCLKEIKLGRWTCPEEGKIEQYPEE